MQLQWLHYGQLIHCVATVGTTMLKESGFTRDCGRQDNDLRHISHRATVLSGLVYQCHTGKMVPVNYQMIVQRFLVHLIRKECGLATYAGSPICNRKLIGQHDETADCWWRFEFSVDD